MVVQYTLDDAELCPQKQDCKRNPRLRRKGDVQLMLLNNGRWEAFQNSGSVRDSLSDLGHPKLAVTSCTVAAMLSAIS